MPPDDISALKKIIIPVQTTSWPLKCIEPGNFFDNYSRTSIGKFVTALHQWEDLAFVGSKRSGTLDYTPIDVQWELYIFVVSTAKKFLYLAATLVCIPRQNDNRVTMSIVTRCGDVVTCVLTLELPAAGWLNLKASPLLALQYQSIGKIGDRQDLSIKDPVLACLRDSSSQEIANTMGTTKNFIFKI
ncbi:hypothetical protein BDR06DRAFT_977885 [Suillus hirtellus]|nr:hypothetical protein BDR06DRAFT_978022 [Suillus hirtellus]KAG2045895.1 hypothetical protein BDR06DRAFT_977885 [Suillus hirtellus]